MGRTNFVVLFSCAIDISAISSPPACSSLTTKWFGHRAILYDAGLSPVTADWPLSWAGLSKPGVRTSTAVLWTEMWTGPPTLFRHTSPDTVHPSLSFCAHGAPGGPFLNALTFNNSGESRPMRTSTLAFVSRGRIWWAISFRWGNLRSLGLEFRSCQGECGRILLASVGRPLLPRSISLLHRWRGGHISPPSRHCRWTARTSPCDRWLLTCRLTTVRPWTRCFGHRSCHKLWRWGPAGLSWIRLGGQSYCTIVLRSCYDRLQCRLSSAPRRCIQHWVSFSPCVTASTFFARDGCGAGTGLVLWC